MAGSSSELSSNRHISTVSSTVTARIAALDFTKGALVLFMVLYHWLNYFLGPGGTVYRYLRFLPPSFIFITGFLISNAYLSKYALTDSRLPKRLLVRGFKVLAVFVLLNLAIIVLLTGFHNLSAGNYLAVFVTGNVLIVGVGKAAAFYVLVPISYLLFLSAILLVPYRLYKYTFHFVLAVLVMSIFALDAFGYRSNNLELVSIGLLGLILGFTPVEKINAFVRHPYILAVAYICYTTAITMWEPNYVLQAVGVCLTVALFYLLGTTQFATTVLGNQVILLGKYPLFGYIIQIAILQVLRRALFYVILGPTQLALSFVVAVALTMMAVIALNAIRAKSRVIDSMYKAIFA